MVKSKLVCGNLYSWLPSLDFELRAWISDFNDRMMVASELNQDIENEFQITGIVIPFPQRDLHLKSVDTDAINAIQEATVDPLQR